MRRAIISFLLLCLLGACSQRSVVGSALERFEDVAALQQSYSSPLVTPAPDALWAPGKLPQVIRGSPDFFPEGSANAWQTHWYRIRTSVANASDLAIYIPRARWPRLQGRLDIFVNDVHLSESSIVWNSPVIIDVPAGAIARSGPVEVFVALSLEHGQSGGLSRVWVGAKDELHVRHAWRQFFQQRVPQVTGISFAFLGVFSFLFWLKRRNEAAYLLFAIAAGLNLLRNLHYYFVNPESFGNGFWWMTINSLAWSMLASHLFIVRLHGQRFPRTEMALIGGVTLVTIGSLVAVLAGVTIERWGPLTYLSQILVGLLVPTLSTIGAWRTRLRLALAFAAVLWLNVALGIHDFLLTNWRVSPESAILLPYGAMTILALFLVAMGQRYVQAISGVERLNNSLEELNASLENRLAERTLELEVSHRKLRLVEQEQAVVDERQRLMREMHDGLGSSLMSSLVMVEHGRLSAQQVAEVLRESIDDLKLTIDSLEPMENDLLTLLGTLRYRLGKRLGAAGIALEWKVEETPPLPWLNPTSALQILRILQEALTNTLKHARASTIRVATLFDATTISIRLVDDGIGFDAADDQNDRGGRGLKNMRRRANTLGAHIEIDSQPGRTAVTLVLSRERRAVSRDSSESLRNSSGES